jgi:hypothetical protein
MGIEDRDWYRDAVREREATESGGAFRKPPSPPSPLNHPRPSASPKRFGVWQFMLYTFAFIGFVHWVKAVARMLLRIF